MTETATLDGHRWHLNPCPTCAGTGRNARNRLIDCRTCAGRGYVRTLIERVNPQRSGTPLGHYEREL